MVFLFKKPFVYIIVAIVAILTSLALISYSGILKTTQSKPEFSLISLTPTEAKLGQTVTLTIMIKNYAKTIQEVEFHINITSPRVKFSYRNGTPIEQAELGKWYIINYPNKKMMAPDEEWTEELKIIATLADEKSYSYSIYFNLYSYNEITDGDKRSLIVSR